MVNPITVGRLIALALGAVGAYRAYQTVNGTGSDYAPLQAAFFGWLAWWAFGAAEGA